MIRMRMRSLTDHRSRVAAKNRNSHAHSAGDSYSHTHYETAPASSAGHLNGGPVGAGGDGQEGPRPVELHHEDAAKDEPADDADNQTIELSGQPDLDQLSVPDGCSKHNCKNGSHQRRHQHTGNQDYTGVLHKTCQGQNVKY